VVNKDKSKEGVKGKKAELKIKKAKNKKKKMLSLIIDAQSEHAFYICYYFYLISLHSCIFIHPSVTFTLMSLYTSAFDHRAV
jgi:hypothetical protein